MKSKFNVSLNDVQPFELKDPTVPGRRTIAEIFLVDPNNPIVSTSDVPPQQRSWHDAASHLYSVFPKDVQGVLGAKREQGASFPVSLA